MLHRSGHVGQTGTRQRRSLSFLYCSFIHITPFRTSLPFETVPLSLSPYFCISFVPWTAVSWYINISTVNVFSLPSTYDRPQTLSQYSFDDSAMIFRPCSLSSSFLTTVYVPGACLELNTLNAFPELLILHTSA